MVAGRRARAGLPTAAALGVYAPGIGVSASGSTLPADDTTTLTITVTVPDRSSGALTGQVVTLASDHSATFGSVTDVGDGTYTATFKTGTAATHVISATVGGRLSPNTVSLTASAVNAADPAHSTISVDNATPTLGTDTVTATVTSLDSGDAAVTVGGLTVVFGNSGGTSAGTWSATTDHGDGTYTAVFTPTADGTATTVTATMGGVAVTGGSAPTITVAAGGYATPNILNNASFEAADPDVWDGFTINGSSGTPDGMVRSTDWAKNGSYCIKRDWDHNAGDLPAHVYYNIGTQTHIWTRIWFNTTAWPNGGGFKFFRYQDTGFTNVNGIQTLNGNLAYTPTWGSGSGYAYIYLTTLPSINTDHALEFEIDFTNKQARFWLDDVQLGPGTIYDDPSHVCSWSGQTLTCTSMVQPLYLDLCRLINPTTNAGSMRIDRVAISTLGRIGP